ncbi:MAG: hypothetical protein SO296_09515 [Prevotella sp.]|nr:hypothetical protein [Prevotella sp.]
MSPPQHLTTTTFYTQHLTTTTFYTQHLNTTTFYTQHLTTTTFYTQHLNTTTFNYGRHAVVVAHFDGFGPITSSSVPPWRISLKST